MNRSHDVDRGFRRKSVISLKTGATHQIKYFLSSLANQVSRRLAEESETYHQPSAIREKFIGQYIIALQEYIFSQVIPCDVETVARMVLAGVEDALRMKREEYEHIKNVKRFSNEVNLIVKFSELICISNLRVLDLESISPVLRADLLVNLERFHGVRELYLGHGSTDSERMEKYYSLGISCMRHLTHFSLRRNCSDKIIEILSKTSKHSLQELDVEGSRDVTDDCIQHLATFRLKTLNIFNCNITVSGLGAILQTVKCLLHLKRGVELCQALEYQQLIDDATRRQSRKLQLRSFQASEKIHFHTDQDLGLVSNACPHINKMIFKFNPDYFSNYSQLAVFEKLQHLETWGGDFHNHHLEDLLQIIGGNLTVLHLCHVEEMDPASILCINKSCQAIQDLKFENCSLANLELSSEEWEIFNLKLEPMLSLQKMQVVGEISVDIVASILKKAYNVQKIELDTDINIKDETILEILQCNSLQNLKQLLIYSSRYLTVSSLWTLLTNCPNLTWVRYIDSWRSNTSQQIDEFRDWIRQNNIDLDTGEEEIKQERKRRQERLMGKNPFKSTFCSTDILSKMFGPSFQEGEGYSDGDKHLLENAFPQEGEGRHPV